MHLGGGHAQPVGLAGEVAARLGRADRVALVRSRAYRSRTLVAASVQPSVAVRRNVDKMASVVPTPSITVSIQP